MCVVDWNLLGWFFFVVLLYVGDYVIGDRWGVVVYLYLELIVGWFWICSFVGW